jgi:hypothetical protein
LRHSWRAIRRASLFAPLKHRLSCSPAKPIVRSVPAHIALHLFVSTHFALHRGVRTLHTLPTLTTEPSVGTYDFFPDDVLYVPVLHINLISQKRLDQKGFCTVIRNDLCMVYQNQILALGGRCDNRTDDLYTASVRVTIDEDESNAIEALSHQDLDGNTCLRAEVPEQGKTLYE